MRTILILTTLLSVSVAGCTSTGASKQPDKTSPPPKARTLPTYSQRLRYKQANEEPSQVGRTTVEGVLVR